MVLWYFGVDQNWFELKILYPEYCNALGVFVAISCHIFLACLCHICCILMKNGTK